MVDGLVDLIDRRLEVSGGEIVVLGKTALERLKLAFKLGDVDILRLNERQLCLVFQRVGGSVSQKRNHRQEELRSDHVHFWIAVENVDNTRIIEFAVGLKQ